MLSDMTSGPLKPLPSSQRDELDDLVGVPVGDIAAALGVNVNTVKRWDGEGGLSFRTAGGHRRIRVSEARRILREHGKI